MKLWFDELYTENTKFSIKVDEHIYTERTPFQRIDFFKSYDYGMFFTLDGYMMVNEKDEFIYHDMITHVPMAVNPDIKRVLVIGGGDGGTVRELTRYETIESIDLVEIDERVVRLCQKYLPITSSKLEDERVKMHFEDGIRFISDKENVYDLIIVDSTDPIGPGEGLFTLDFYKNCHKALSENGILINQHESPYYERDAKEMKRAHKKLREIFEICKVYQYHMPTYASGHWLFGFASKSLDPIKDHKKDQWEALGLKTKYYNSNIHKGAFALPTYVIEMLNEK
ncbi:polyamine aminopropyltransferase [Tissierella sp. Yu-01]|uniref:polyamine aminopropyltransferase n=1 Tax=Tissierella sp. Yu-01 TaxID=3035694 RepID=UPI00240DC85C|nr:polyamine aminopropyltransferase [Tissierella sp. Yu-01]WFA08600.1 polyamine aminopropyltransferase [Tissierella sp. Yu-01]